MCFKCPACITVVVQLSSHFRAPLAMGHGLFSGKYVQCCCTKSYSHRLSVCCKHAKQTVLYICLVSSNSWGFVFICYVHVFVPPNRYFLIKKRLMARYICQLLPSTYRTRARRSNGNGRWSSILYCISNLTAFDVRCRLVVKLGCARDCFETFCGLSHSDMVITYNCLHVLWRLLSDQLDVAAQNITCEIFFVLG
jgi:hypothetical protein